MKKNFLYTAISVGSRLLVGLLLFLLLARLWGPQDFGTFAFVFSICALLMLVVDFGFALFLMREVAAHPDQAVNLLSQSLRAKLALCLPLAMLSLLAWAILGSGTLPPSLFAALLTAALLMSFVDFFAAPLRALGRYDLETVLVTAGNTVQFLLAGGVAWAGGGVLLVALAMVASRAVFLAAAWQMLRRVVPGLRWRGGGGAVRSTLRRVWPYGVDGMLTTAWSQLDVVAVRLLLGVQAAGLYTAGQKIVQGVSALAPVVGNVMIPRLSRQAAQRDPGFWRTASKTGLLMAGTGLFFAWPLLVWPEAIVHALFGPAYAPLAPLMPWFGLLLVVRYVGASFGLTLTAAGQQHRRLRCQLLGLVCFAVMMAAGTVLAVDLTYIVLAMLGSFVVLTLGYAHQLRAHRRQAQAA